MLSELINNPEISDFILKHRNDDVKTLMLRRPGPKDWNWFWIGQQIEGYQKARIKIPNFAENPGIIYPKRISLEQCSSELTANFKSGLFKGAKLLDLSGGFGVDSMAFTSSYDSIDYVEQEGELCEIAEHNVARLGLQDKFNVHNCTAEDFLSTSNSHYDLVYIDPARRDTSGKKVFRFSDCSPNVLQWKADILERSSKLLIKASPMLDIHQGIKDLENVSKVWILASPRECKELLFLVEKDFAGVSDIHCIQLDSDADFSFKYSEEKELQLETGDPGNFFYLPPPSVTKSGGYKSFASFYNINLVHPNTHVYSSEKLKREVPGRILKIEKSIRYGDKIDLLDLGYTLILRNFRDDLKQIRKKYRIKEGGQKFLVFYTDNRGSQMISICNTSF